MKRQITKKGKHVLTLPAKAVKKIVQRLPCSNKVECPCGWKGKEFLPFGVPRRKNAQCPKCLTVERARLYYFYFKKILPHDKKLKVLHFAPEEPLTSLFKSYKNIEYLSADLDPSKALIKQDITNLTFEDNSFDIIVCSHVFEYVKDDIKAMWEVHRVLKPTGFAILQVPIHDHFKGRKIDKTFADASFTESLEGGKEYDTSNHFWIYSRDYPERLQKAGFQVRIDKYLDSLSHSDVKKYSLYPQNKSWNETAGWIFYCTK
jgi:predicted SAM-dependent methyltransferase